MRKLITVILTGVALLALAAPAMAQYPPAAPVVAVSDTTVVPGQTIGVAGDGWLPGSQVTFTFFSTPVVLGTANVDANGQFTSQVTIPADATEGPHTLRTTGTDAASQPRTVDVALNVVSAAAPAGVTPAPGLPRTGSDAFGALLGAAGLLTLGSAALVVARRRNRAEMSA